MGLLEFQNTKWVLMAVALLAITDRRAMAGKSMFSLHISFTPQCGGGTSWCSLGGLSATGELLERWVVAGGESAVSGHTGPFLGSARAALQGEGPDNHFAAILLIHPFWILGSWHPLCL